MSICDKYFSWGWSNNRIVEPLGDPSIRNKKNMKFIDNKNILFVSGNFNIYKITNTIHDKNILEKKTIQIVDFFNILSSTNIEKVFIKNHPKEYRRELNFKKNLGNEKLNIKYVKEKNLDRVMNNFSILVFPYQLPTPFLKYLSLNKPCLALIDLEYVSNEALNDVKNLIEVGIFYSSGKELGQFINDNINDIETWWNNEKLQKARKKFCDKYIKKNITLDKIIKSLRSI